MKRALLISYATAALLFACTAPAPSDATVQSAEPRTTTSPVANPQSGPSTTESASTGAPAERSPRTVVERFGHQLDKVSTLAPPADVERAMRSAWSDYVAPELLDRWVATPSASPGRTVSSPRPDRIEIERVAMTGNDHALVDGFVIQVTSSGVASRDRVRIELERRGGRWLITGYTAGPPEAVTEDDPARVIREYYAAISARDFRRAWEFWGADGRPGQAFDNFVRGFAETASVRVDPGTPSRIGAAAGSRYVDIPVRVAAVTRSGEQQHFEGTYTLRRSVVDGATPPQRRWHLYRASLHSVR